MRITKPSEKGLQFSAAHEGFASKAYRCPAGVITIGFGFTWASVIFRQWWLHKYGAKLKMGDTMTLDEALTVLRLIMTEEYGKAVADEIVTEKQWEFDGAADMALNAGTGSLKWRWAQALKRGDAAEAARLIVVTAVTAAGKVLAGLKKRRMHEAYLIRDGEYGNYRVSTINSPSVSNTSDAITEYQAQLAKLGYLTASDVDGTRGPKSRNAVKAFQRDNGLLVDGIVGPATRAALIRALDKKAQGTTTITTAGAGAGAAGTDGVVNHSAGIDPSTAINYGVWIVVAVVVVYVGFQLWRHRGAITGQRVPT